MKYSYVILLLITSLFPNLDCSSPNRESSVQKNMISATLTDSAIANATYYLPLGLGVDTITLVNGSWEGAFHLDPDDSDDVEHNSLKLYDVVYGDLRGNGKVDAAVVLGHWTGGSGVWISLNAVTDSNNHPTQLALTYLGDRTTIDSIWIDSSIIKVAAHDYPDDDSVFFKFKLVGNKLEQLK